MRWQPRAAFPLLRTPRSRSARSTRAAARVAWATIGCFSFYPTKNLGAFGDAGLCTTNDEALAAELLALRVHGRTGTYYHEYVGMASRMDAIQAAILEVKLKYLDDWSDRRTQHAALYSQAAW